MTEKILISTDKNGFATFQKNVQSTAEAATQLIQAYEAFQPWAKVRSLEAFMELVSDPAACYDATLLKNVTVQAIGVKPNPGKLAELVGLFRNEYLNLVSGLPLIDTECAPCKKVQAKPGRKAISKYHFDEYSQYLNFNSGVFSVNETAVNENLDQFNFYISTEEEIRVYRLHHNLVEILNEFIRTHPISLTQTHAVKEAFRLHLTRGGEGDFVVNVESMKNAINKLKYQSNEKN